jgi:chromosome segregation ATPase
MIPLPVSAAKHQAVVEERDTLKADLEAREQEITTLQGQLSELSANYADLEKERDAALEQGDSTDLTQQLADSNAQIKDLTSQVQALGSQLAASEENLTKANTQITELQAEVTRLGGKPGEEPAEVTTQGDDTGSQPDLISFMSNNADNTEACIDRLRAEGF